MMLPIAPPPELSSSLDLLEQVFRLVAYPLGAAWLYFQFVRGRVFKPRLEPALEGAIVSVAGQRYLKARLQIKNVGQSRVRFSRAGTALRIQTAPPPYAVWGHHRTVDTLQADETLEPGEALHEEQVHSLASTPLDHAVRLELWLEGKHAMWRTVVAILPQEGTEHDKDAARTDTP